MAVSDVYHLEPQRTAYAGRGSSGERTRLACWLRRLAATHLALPRKLAQTGKSSRWRGRHRQHARRARSPELNPVHLTHVSNDPVH
jgi:hypothetical protein